MGLPGLSGQLAVKVERAAELLDVSKSQIYSMLNRGQLRSIKIGSGSKGGVRVCTHSLAEFVAGGGVENNGPSAEAKLAASRAKLGQSSKTWMK